MLARSFTGLTTLSQPPVSRSTLARTRALVFAPLLDSPPLPLAFALLSLLGCSGHPAPRAAALPRSSTHDEPTRDAMTRAPDAIAPAPRCTNADAPALTRYDEVREGARFSLRVRREPSGAWGPVEPLAMPMHHASTLQFEPPIDALVAESDRGRIVTVIAVGVGRRSLVFDTRRRTWFATFVARVERACAIFIAGTDDPR